MVIENQKLTIPAPKPLSFAFCTDTLPIQNLNEYINGVDTLYHEATFGSELIEIAKETMHSTAAQAAMIAKQVNAKQLVIGHFSSRYKSMEKLIEEAKEVFPDTIEAIDGLLIDISKTNC